MVRTEGKTLVRRKKQQVWATASWQMTQNVVWNSWIYSLGSRVVRPGTQSVSIYMRWKVKPRVHRKPSPAWLMDPRAEMLLLLASAAILPLLSHEGSFVWTCITVFTLTVPLTVNFGYANRREMFASPWINMADVGFEFAPRRQIAVKVRLCVSVWRRHLGVALSGGNVLAHTWTFQGGKKISYLGI